jgi:hypothetical protein
MNKSWNVSELLSTNFADGYCGFSEADKVFIINYLRNSMSAAENLGLGCGGFLGGWVTAG